MRLFANRRLFVTLLAVILLVVSIGLTRERGGLTWAEAGLKNAGAWLSGWLATPSQAVADWFGGDVVAGDGSESDRILQLKAEVARLKQENDNLKEVAGYDKEDKRSYITAKTVARSPDRWNDRVVIDRGKDDGVKKGMPVITEEGLIGRVSAATDHMADVQLMTDSGSTPGIAAQVQAKGKNVFGLIEGYDAKKKRLLLKKVPDGAELKKGQLVVTSGLSDLFPGDLLIGTVDEVTRGEFGVDRMVYVKPAARFEQLHYVMVVRDPAKIHVEEHRKELNKRKGGGD
ncbi:MAG: rod shape-determining protein MreC [Firmicutes bacterium]|nr:rod shape-determining protein MreC [Melghirimyces thermohalophilus]MDA8354148.1 rod shape-determining protein MreC [Bacillota bacterium]